ARRAPRRLARPAAGRARRRPAGPGRYPARRARCPARGRPRRAVERHAGPAWHVLSGGGSIPVIDPSTYMSHLRGPNRRGFRGQFRKLVEIRSREGGNRALAVESAPGEARGRATLAGRRDRETRRGAPWLARLAHDTRVVSPSSRGSTGQLPPFTSGQELVGAAGNLPVPATDTGGSAARFIVGATTYAGIELTRDVLDATADAGIPVTRSVSDSAADAGVRAARHIEVATADTRAAKAAGDVIKTTTHTYVVGARYVAVAPTDTGVVTTCRVALAATHAGILAHDRIRHPGHKASKAAVLVMVANHQVVRAAAASSKLVLVVAHDQVAQLVGRFGVALPVDDLDIAAAEQ